MLDGAQFLHILAAEAKLLVTVLIYLTNEVKAKFEHLFNDMFASDSYSDIARLWNEEQSQVIQEALEYNLVPVGTKWAREWLQEEVEDILCYNFFPLSCLFPHLRSMTSLLLLCSLLPRDRSILTCSPVLFFSSCTSPLVSPCSTGLSHSLVTSLMVTAFPLPST